MRRASIALLAFAFVGVARGEWDVANSQSEFSADRRVEHRHIALRSAAGNDAALDLALFSPARVAVRVIDNANGSDDLARAMQREHCIAGVNGGYFEMNFAPLGLRVIDGATTSHFTRARLLSGVFAAGGKVIELVRVGEFSAREKIHAAIECGPFLVDGGAAVVGLENTRAARRTFVAATREKKFALGFCDDAKLAQLGAILSSEKLASDLHISRAMNLDGGSSSAFFFQRADGTTLSIPEEKTVRDFVGVMAR